MEVYVLMGYERVLIDMNDHIRSGYSYLLGVYHTQSDAEFAREEYDRENGGFDDYSIVRRVIGAKAKWGLI